MKPAKKQSKKTDYGPCSHCKGKIKPHQPYFGPPKLNDEGTDHVMPDFFCSGKCRDKGVSE